METETPLISETIALTEKKVAMALDDLIKLSKTNTNLNRAKKPRRHNKKRNQNFNSAARNTTSSRHLNSLSLVRQGAVAKKRRSNFHGNQFPVTKKNIARKACAAPLFSRAFNAERMTNANQSRLISPPVQNISIHMKRHQKVENRGGKKKTLDSRFASMKEQRSSKNNNYGVTVHVPRRMPPWARARIFPN